jgi:septum formation protein
MKLILASASIGRRMVLEQAGLDFEIVPSELDERAIDEDDPVNRAVLLARTKAQLVSARHNRDWIIGSDTLVTLEDGATILEKPSDPHDARRMMELQSGKASTVYSSICVVRPGDKAIFEDISHSLVFFKELLVSQIDEWIDSGCWEGSAGAFRIHELEKRDLLDKVEGSRSGVIGISFELLEELLAQAKYPPLP